MLILASNSPRRKQLLSLGGWDFTTLAPQVDESVLPGEAPMNYVERLARTKAGEALSRLQAQKSEAEQGGQHPIPIPQIIILAADTAVVDPQGVDGRGETSQILGKPSGPQEAEAMLRRLRGRTHQVFTGLAVLMAVDLNQNDFQRQDGTLLISQVVITDVPMRDYSDEEMMAYIATGDPLDKAGAYAIQHPVFQPVQNLQGCYANVMGLPVCHAAAMLAQLGVHPTRAIVQECRRELDYPCQVYLQAARDWVEN